LASRRKSWRARAVLALVVSLGAHVAWMALLASAVRLGPNALLTPSSGGATSAGSPTSAEDDRPMEIQTIVNQLDRPETKTPEELRREEQQKKEEEDKNPHGQVVDIARPTIEERPDKADYVAEYDSKVDRQTKGPNGRGEAGAREAPSAAETPPPAAPAVSQPPLPDGRPDARPERPGPLAMRETERRHAAERVRSGGDEPKDADGERPPPGPRAPGGPRPDARDAAAAQPRGPNGDGALGVPGGRPGQNGEQRPNLAASRDMLERAIGKGAGSMDYLKDVDDGESTALNAKKWKHAPFFNRVKRSVQNEWHPDVVYMRHDPSGNVYGVKDRVTVLRIHLQPDGKLAAWTLLQSSGVDFLDDEAIDAFRKAAPFPNPPRDLVETDGQIHFNFAFIFELSGRTSVKFFKYQ
jgi:TonB family protein